MVGEGGNVCQFYDKFERCVKTFLSDLVTVARIFPEIDPLGAFLQKDAAHSRMDDLLSVMEREEEQRANALTTHTSRDGPRRDLSLGREVSFNTWRERRGGLNGILIRRVPCGIDGAILSRKVYGTWGT